MLILTISGVFAAGSHTFIFCCSCAMDDIAKANMIMTSIREGSCIKESSNMIY